MFCWYYTGGGLNVHSRPLHISTLWLTLVPSAALVCQVRDATIRFRKIQIMTPLTFVSLLACGAYIDGWIARFSFIRGALYTRNECRWSEPAPGRASSDMPLIHRKAIYVEMSSHCTTGHGRILNSLKSPSLLWRQSNTSPSHTHLLQTSLRSLLVGRPRPFETIGSFLPTDNMERLRLLLCYQCIISYKQSLFVS